MKKLIITFIFTTAFLFSVSNLTFATSGACSYHLGVNCSAGPHYDGSVTCNDGWNDSSVKYRDMIECQTASSCPVYLDQQSYTQLRSMFSQVITEANQKIKEADKAAQDLCYTRITNNYSTTQASYQSCINYMQGLHSLFLSQGGIGFDQSLNVHCGEAPTTSNQCADETSSIGIKYLGLIADAQREIDCMKLITTPNPTYSTQQPPQPTNDERASCVKWQMDRNASGVKPVMAIDGICCSEEKGIIEAYAKEFPELCPIPKIQNPTPKVISPNNEIKKTTTPSKKVEVKKNTEIDSENTETLIVSNITPDQTPKVTFWQRVGSIFKKLKFW